eukprot:COSAG02_NODE_8972_length_2377_cov_2.300702_1_plen_624_part_00
MGRRKEQRKAPSGSSAGSWLGCTPAGVIAAVAAVVISIGTWILSSQGRGGPAVGRASRAAAAAEWDSFRDLILTKQRTRVSLSDEAVGLLDACLGHDVGHPECAFWRARDLMQRGSNLNTLRARDLLASIDVDAVSTADPVDVLYLYATAAETCGDEDGQMLGYNRVLELVEERDLDFTGLPNIYAGLAAVHRGRGHYQESQKAALAGIRAAKKRGGKGSSSNLRSVLSFASALPALHDALGAAKAAAAGGAVEPAREHYAEVLQKLFPRWKQEEKVSAAQRFGLTLAELRFAVDPPLTSVVDVDHTANSGGWLPRLPPSDSDSSKDTENNSLVCDIDVVECVSDKEAFLKRYVDGNRPVLLRNFLNRNGDDGDASDCTGAGQHRRRPLWPWPALHHWRREMLLEQHGSVVVPIRQSSQVKAEYERARGSQLFANETTLADFLAKMRTDENMLLAANRDEKGNESIISDPPYVFDPIAAIGRGTEYESLLPLFADEERFSEFDLALDRANQLSIGGTNSGVSWHKHSQAYNALVFGSKRWFLSPPNHAPGNQVQSSHEWAIERETLPVEHRDTTVLTCDQQAGDVMYVPQQWWHSTLCLQESIGLAQQLGGRRGFFQLQMNLQ